MYFLKNVNLSSGCILRTRPDTFFPARPDQKNYAMRAVCASSLLQPIFMSIVSIWRSVGVQEVTYNTVVG